MVAIIRLGNQQFKVQAGDFVRGAFLKDSKETLQIPVLAIEDKSGFLLDSSELKNAKVTAKVLREGLSKKVLVFKKKRRKGYRKTRGHRQKFTELQILEIALGSSKSSIDSNKIVSSKKGVKKTKQKVAVKKAKAKKSVDKKKNLKPAKKIVAKKTSLKPTAKKAKTSTTKKTVTKKAKTSTTKKVTKK